MRNVKPGMNGDAYHRAEITAWCRIFVVCPYTGDRLVPWLAVMVTRRWPEGEEHTVVMSGRAWEAIRARLCVQVMPTAIELTVIEGQHIRWPEVMNIYQSL